MSIEAVYDGWHLVEPPEAKLPDPDTMPPDDDEEWGLEPVGSEQWRLSHYAAKLHEYRQAELATIAERLDGAGAHDLFDGVSTKESGNELSFVVPPRIIETKDKGVWVLPVSGERKWFKEHDDYGEIECTTTGEVFWRPHLYPLEETDQKNMPLIADMERYDMTIVLKPMDELADSYTCWPPTEIVTEFGHFGAEPNIGLSHNPNRWYYYTTFAQIDGGRNLVAQKVEISDPTGPSVVSILSHLYANGRREQASRIIRGEESIPEEYGYSSARENHHSERENSTLTGTPFGEMWLPVRVLRSGSVHAKISFPDFQKA